MGRCNDQKRGWSRYAWMLRPNYGCARPSLWLFWALDCLLKRAGPFLIALAILLILLVSLVYLLFIWPQLRRKASWAGGPVLHLAGGLFLLFNILVNFCLAAFTPPGFTCPGKRVDSGPEPLKFCKRCKLPKPPFAHHCHICERCVLRMDHHCPWLGACVGFANHRAFILFLLYLTLGCIYVVCTAAWVLRRNVSPSEGDRVPAEGPMALVFALALSATIGLLLLPLLAWHLYLGATAQTTIEFFKNRSTASQLRSIGVQFTNQYDLGVVLNLQGLFDVDGFWWWLLLLLPHFTPKKGDGYRFLSVYNMPFTPYVPPHESMV